MRINIGPVLRNYFKDRTLEEAMNRHHAKAFYDLSLVETPVTFADFYSSVLEYSRTLGKPLPRFGMLQEEFVDDPWKLLVACSLLNLTNVRQVWGVIDELFEQFPSWKAVNDSSYHTLCSILRPLGLYNRRARGIIKLSAVWPDKDDERLRALPTVGQYAWASYEIFINDNLQVETTDKELTRYLDWRRAC